MKYPYHLYHYYPLPWEIFGTCSNSSSSMEKDNKYFSNILSVVFSRYRPPLFCADLLPNHFDCGCLPIHYFDTSGSDNNPSVFYFYHYSNACIHKSHNSNSCLYLTYAPCIDQMLAVYPHKQEEGNTYVYIFYRIDDSCKTYVNFKSILCFDDLGAEFTSMYSNF